MEAFVKISPRKATAHEGAVISLCGENAVISDLYFDFSQLLKSVRRPSAKSLDFLLVAATVYALDKLTPRSETENGWERTFSVSIPVKNAKIWSRSSRKLNECVSFLSGDKWQFTFTERKHSIVRKKKNRRRTRIVPRSVRGEMVCLFSGGLDSLIGAIDELHASKDRRIVFVGHHDPQISGVVKDQKQLLKALENAYPKQFESVLMGIGNSEKSTELTMRSRSLLFISLGILVASHLGDGTPLLMPENGTIALNIPLTPARRGSCSTRTAHPHYLLLLEKWLHAVGLNHPIRNPLIGKTKGEAVSQCLNRDLLSAVVSKSTSCAKSSHTRWWVRKNVKECGKCMPCIYRRAALHTAGLDTEFYGNNICNGEVKVTDSKNEAADDFRACLSFLHGKYSREDVAKMLIAAAPLPSLEVLGYADTVVRAMDEIRQLLRDKATRPIQKMAGI